MQLKIVKIDICVQKKRFVKKNEDFCLITQSVDCRVGTFDQSFSSEFELSKKSRTTDGTSRLAFLTKFGVVWFHQCKTEK